MKLTLVSNGDDWEGLYVNGELACEGHEVSPEDVAAVFERHLDRIYVDPFWLQQRGYLPKNLTEVKAYER